MPASNGPVVWITLQGAPHVNWRTVPAPAFPVLGIKGNGVESRLELQRVLHIREAKHEILFVSVHDNVIATADAQSPDKCMRRIVVLSRALVVRKSACLRRSARTPCHLCDCPPAQQPLGYPQVGDDRSPHQGATMIRALLITFSLIFGIAASMPAVSAAHSCGYSAACK
jgi:hypothetical protein